MNDLISRLDIPGGYSHRFLLFTGKTSCKSLRFYKNRLFVKKLLK